MAAQQCQFRASDRSRSFAAGSLHALDSAEMSVQVGVQKMCTDAVKMVDVGNCTGEVGLGSSPAFYFLVCSWGFGLFGHNAFDLSVCTEFDFDHIE